MEIIIANDMERENLFAEIRDGDHTWAEVIYDDERGGYTLTIYPTGAGPDPKEWIVLDFDQALKALVEAKAALVLRGYPESRTG